MGAAYARRGWAVLAGLSLAIAQLPVGAAAARGEAGSAEAGARLFSGQTRFAGGGPSCASCHPIAGLPFPGGGTMGPDLTDISPRIGPEALGVVLATLFFPTMNPVFAGRLLTALGRGGAREEAAAGASEHEPEAHEHGQEARTAAETAAGGGQHVHRVSISDFKFTPATLEGHVGDVVEWKNTDFVAHTATSDDQKTFDTGRIDAGEMKRVVARAKGRIPYFCRYHVAMKGVLVVQ